MTQQGQHYQQPPPQYQQPPPQQYPPGYNPEVDSIKSMVNIASIFGIIMVIIMIIAALGLIFLWATWESNVYDPYGIWDDAAPAYYLGVSIFCFIGIALGFLFYMNCKQINDMVDRGQYVQAKSKTLVWMIIGIIFVWFIPGILLLIAYLKFDSLIRATQPAYYPPPPQQQYQQPPQQQYQQPPPPQQQYPPPQPPPGQ